MNHRSACRPLLCRELFQNLAQVKSLGIGVLLVEQNAKQSLAIADRGYLLENTRIIHEDTAARLAGDPAVQKGISRRWRAKDVSCSSNPRILNLHPCLASTCRFRCAQCNLGAARISKSGLSIDRPGGEGCAGQSVKRTPESSC